MKKTVKTQKCDNSQNATNLNAQIVKWSKRKNFKTKS